MENVDTKNENEKYTPESVWQFIQELGEKIKMDSEEFKEQMKELRESQKETDRQMKETEKIQKENALQQKETDRLVRENAKEIGGISKSNGDMAEEAIFNALEREKTFAGIKFDYIGKNWKRHSKALNLKGEYDVLLENGDTIAIIETKYKVKKNDVSELLTDKVENFRKLFPLYSNFKILLGVGGMSFEKEAIKEAKDNGVGIIKIVGDTVEYYTDGIREY